MACGAFAAHGVSDPTARELLRTGALYAFVHALAALVSLGLARIGMERARLAAPPFVVGSALFSGSLYALALGAPRWTGFLTPFGGLLFLAGWAVLGWATLAPAETGV